MFAVALSCVDVKEMSQSQLTLDDVNTMEDAAFAECISTFGEYAYHDDQIRDAIMDRIRESMGEVSQLSQKSIL